MKKINHITLGECELVFIFSNQTAIVNCISDGMSYTIHLKDTDE